MVKFGIGYDIHPLERGSKLIIGGLEIRSEFSSKGHSDGDALTHAIIDALLGAASLGDIGKHFPDTDPKYKGIDSKILLKEVMVLIRAKGYELVNIDSTICLQTPKIGSYIPEMQKVLSNSMGVDINLVSIKATTTETLGFVGREEGVSAYATVLITKI